MRIKILILLLLIPTPLLAQSSQRSSWWGSSQAEYYLSRALTDAGQPGMIKWATASLPTCNTANKGATAFDTTSGTFKGCDGTSWAALGGGLTSGTTAITGCGANQLLYEGAAGGTLDCNAIFLASEAVSALVVGGAVDAASTVQYKGTGLVAEGTTADVNETTVGFTDPTADTTINFPALGVGTYTVATTDGTQTLTNKTLTTPALTSATDTQVCFYDGTTIACGDAGLTYIKATDILTAVGGVWHAAADAANAIGVIPGTGITFEGATADAFEGLVTLTDPTADRTFTLPDRSGTVALSGDTLTGDISATLNASGATTTTIGADKVLESHLKAVDAAGDEECLTYEATGGDFEWQACGGASLPVVDTTSVVEGSVDATKEIRFEVDGLTTGTVRVLTPPDANIVLAGSAAALTSGRVPFVTTGGLLLDDADYTYDATNNAIKIPRIGMPAGIASTDFNFYWSTEQTVDSLHLGIDTGSRNIAIVDGAALGGNYAHAQQTNPTLFIHSATGAGASTTQWISFTHNQTNGVIDVGTGALVVNDDIAVGSATGPWLSASGFQIGSGNYHCWNSGAGGYGGSADTCLIRSAAANVQFGTNTTVGSANAVSIGTTGLVFEGATADAFEATLGVVDPVADGTIYLDSSGWQGTQSKALTEASATAFVQVAVASGSNEGGLVHYTIKADDATDFQSRSGVLVFTVVNKAGTETCSLGRPDGGTTVDNTTDVAAVSAGTLTNTFTCDTTPANAINIAANATSSLTQTTLTIEYRVEILSGTATVTPQ